MHFQLCVCIPFLIFKSVALNLLNVIHNFRTRTMNYKALKKDHGNKPSPRDRMNRIKAWVSESVSLGNGWYISPPESVSSDETAVTVVQNKEYFDQAKGKENVW